MISLLASLLVGNLQLTKSIPYADVRVTVQTKIIKEQFVTIVRNAPIELASQLVGHGFKTLDGNQLHTDSTKDAAIKTFQSTVARIRGETS